MASKRWWTCNTSKMLKVMLLLIVFVALVSVTVLLPQTINNNNNNIIEVQVPKISNFYITESTSLKLKHATTTTTTTTTATNDSYASSSFPLKLLGKYNNQKMILVHVGKAGGETLKWRIKMICDIRKSPKARYQCQEQFAKTIIDQESEFSKHVIGYIHCNAPLQPNKQQVWNDANIFIFTVRNPIDRFLSWFQYMHPHNCFPNEPSGACNLKRKGANGHEWGVQFYQLCFPNVNLFSNALMSQVTKPASIISNNTATLIMTNDDNNNNNDYTIDCSKMAWDTIQGYGPKGPSNHMFWNYQYYINRTIQRYPSKLIMAIRQEYLWQDMQYLEGLFGGSPHHNFASEGPVITHGSEIFRYKAKLQERFVPILCRALQHEITLYVNLLQQAVNIPDPTNSIRHVLNTCNFQNITSESALPS